MGLITWLYCHPGPCISRKYPICPIFSKVMLKFMENFSMTFAENRTYGVSEFAGTEVNRHSGKLKGLSGYLQNHHDTMVGDKTQPQTIWSSAFIWTKISSTYVSFHSRSNRSHNKKSSIVLAEKKSWLAVN